ncbi:hypothetical protein, partial [Plasmodium yoelii yoelii]
KNYTISHLHKLSNAYKLVNTHLESCIISTFKKK